MGPTQMYKYLLLLLVCCGCYNSKTALRQTDKALLKYPAIVGAEIRKTQPCIETPGKVIIDNAGLQRAKDLQDSLDAMSDFYGNLLSNIEPETKVDTLKVTDSAMVQKLLKNVGALNKVNEIQKEQIRKLKDVIMISVHDTLLVKVNDTACDAELKGVKIDLNTALVTSAKKDKWFWIAIGLMGIIGIYTIMKIFKRFV